MSALGQKRTGACNGPCPLYSERPVRPRGKLINVDDAACHTLFPHLGVAPTYSFMSLSMLERYPCMLVQRPAAL